MVEVLQAHGWQFVERKLCCGPKRERWQKPGNYALTITIFPGQQKYTMKSNGKTIKTDTQNTLNEYLKTLV